MARITFKKARSPFSGPHHQTYHVNLDGKRIGTLQELRLSTGITKRWYWYGGGANTIEKPQTFEACKKAAKAFFSRLDIQIYMLGMHNKEDCGLPK